MAFVQLGDTFILGPSGHLWIVISDPAKNAGEFIMVNLTTNVFRAGTDCELNPGDHPWITDKCYVAFGDARKVSVKQEATIVALIQAGTIRSQHQMDTLVLQKIVDAGKKSKALAIAYKACL